MQPAAALDAALTLRLLENRAEDIARVTARENEREMMIERGTRCFVDAASGYTACAAVLQELVTGRGPLTLRHVVAGNRDSALASISGGTEPRRARPDGTAGLAHRSVRHRSARSGGGGQRTGPPEVTRAAAS